MPLSAENLSSGSSDEEYRAAIADSIRQCIEEGKDQAQCQAIAYSMAEKASGRAYPRAQKARKRGVKVTGQGVQTF